MTTGHSKLLSDICEFLKKNQIYYVRTNSHGYGRRGIPDVIACYQGKFVGIEAKVAPDKPTPWQRRELAEIGLAGGQALVVYSVEDLGALGCS